MFLIAQETVQVMGFAFETFVCVTMNGVDLTVGLNYVLINVVNLIEEHANKDDAIAIKIILEWVVH